jgi:cytochrome P450
MEIYRLFTVLLAGVGAVQAFIQPTIQVSSSISIAPHVERTIAKSRKNRINLSQLSSSSTQPTNKNPPSFFEALWGIAKNGSPWEYMIEMRKSGYDGVVNVDLGLIGKYNFLLNPEVVRAVTVEQASILPRRFSVPLFETLELDKGLVYEQGERHKKHKRTCIPSFEQKRSMESFVTATREELDDLSARFESLHNIDLYAEMRQSALNVVLDVSFGLGKEGATNFKKSEQLSKTIAEYLERIVALANEIPPLWQISPRLSSNYVRVTDTLLPTLRSLVSEVIASRRIEEEAGGKKRSRADLLGVLVEEFDDNDIRSILFDVVIAGSDTTASTTTAALYVLHRPENIKWLDRARNEAYETNAGRNISLDEIRTSMPIIVGVAREILRLYPPVPFVGRTATEEGSLCDGKYSVNEGDTFCFSPWFLGRDPTNWREADTFDPQRWIDDPINGGASSMMSWLPFGAGPRGCLGTRLGLTEVVFGIARLLTDFEFDFERSGPIPVKYDLTLNLDGVMQCKIQRQPESQ